MAKGEKLTTFRLDYGMGIELNPLTGKLAKIHITDAKPEEQPAIDRHIETVIAATARNGVPQVPLPAPETPTVAQAAAAVLGDSGLKPTTKKRYAAIFKHFLIHFEPDTRLAEIPQERFAQYADAVNATSAWSDKTKGLYITAAQRLYGYYESRNRAVPRITTKGLKPKRQKPAGRDRPMFSLNDYQILFQNAAKYRVKAPHRWWVTVGCAFLGCRLEELAQAHLHADFGQDKGSRIWFIKIEEVDDDESDDDQKIALPKSVKTFTGWRTVPLHSALIEGGFLDYLERERAAGAGNERSPVPRFGRFAAAGRLLR